jgi:hypothetical protein
MDDVRKVYFGRVYHGICIGVVIILIFWCIREFRYDKDVTDVEFKEFHKTSDDIYPSITFCRKWPFILEKLAKYDRDLTITEYKEFLRGKPTVSGFFLNKKKWDPNWLNIDYDDVTLSLEDVLSKDRGISIHFMTNNDEQIDLTYWNIENNSVVQTHGTSKKYQNVKFINTYVSARQPQYKCFTFDIPVFKGKLIEQVNININGSIFSDGLICWKCKNFFVKFHYPGQFIRAPRGNMVTFKSQMETSTPCYELETFIGSLEVLKRRDKPNQGCNKMWRKHDLYILKDIMTGVKCKPNHWKIDSDLKSCSTYKEYEAIENAFNEKKGSMPPCRSLEKLSKYTYETDFRNTSDCLSSNRELVLKFMLDRETLYKELILVRSYNLQSLVGNAGK